jgi:hypothetical protein
VSSEAARKGGPKAALLLAAKSNSPFEADLAKTLKPYTRLVIALYSKDLGHRATRCRSAHTYEAGGAIQGHQPSSMGSVDVRIEKEKLIDR